MALARALLLTLAACSDLPGPTLGVIAAPVKVAADGRATATIIVRALQPSGHPLFDTPVALTVEGDAVLGAATGTTDAEGVFVTTVASREAGPHVVHATLQGVDASTTATFIAPAAPCVGTQLWSELPPLVALDQSIAVDLDGDGVPDLVGMTGPWPTGKLALAHGRGDRTFDPPRLFGDAPAPDRFAVADLDGDGTLDVFVANGGADASFLRGLGGGAFAPALAVATDPSPTAVVVGDFDGDGKPDVAIANGNGHDVAIVLGRGGAFSVVHTPSPLAATGVPLLVAGDLDGDGKTDLVVADPAGSMVVVLRATGSGAFTAATVPGTPPVHAIALGDVDGDGVLDLAVRTTTSIALLHGHGDATFAALATVVVGMGSDGLALRDVDGDQHLDLVTAAWSPGDVAPGVSVALGNGDGTFRTPRRSEALFANAISVADVDRDGALDLVIVDRDGRTAIQRGDGHGGFAAPARFGGIMNAIAIADLDRDGTPDLASTGAGSTAIELRHGRGDGTFDPPQPIELGTFPGALATSDLDRDGVPDLVATTAEAIAIVFGNTDGAPRDPVMIAIAGNPIAATGADLDGNGTPDLVVLTNDGHLVALLGRGDGAFGDPVTTVAVAGTMTIADLDGDGIPDAAVAGTTTAPTLLVFHGNGDGSFRQTSALGQASIVVARDLDGDGAMDLLAYRFGGPQNPRERNGASVLYRGHGDGRFDPAAILSTAGVVALGAADLDRDGVADAIGIDDDGLAVARGGGAVAPFATYPIPAAAWSFLPSAVAPADLDGDGRLELVLFDGHVLRETGCRP